MSRWPANKAYFWERAPFFRILAPFASGIACYYYMPHKQLPLAAVAWSAVAFSLCYLLLLTGRKKQGLFLVANLSLITLGYSVSGYNDIRSRYNWFGNDISTSHSYLAYISAAPREKERSWKLPVRILATIDKDGTRPAPGNAFVYVRKTDMPLMLHKGDSILLPGKWEQIKDAGNPFEFNYAAYCARNNILHRQWCQPQDVRLYAAANEEEVPVTDKMHDWCMRQMDKYLGHHKARGLLQSMLMGDEVNLDKDLQQAYAETGIVHIIAISGGNVAIFFIVISTLLSWLKHKRYTWIKYAVAMPIVWFYVLAAGAQPSAVRAAAMFSLLSFGIIIRKNNNSLNELFATAFVLLCAEPAWLLSIGFQLSFAAVLSIIIFYKPIYSRVTVTTRKTKIKGIGGAILQRIYDLPRKLWSVVAVSIAAEMLIAPLVIYYFHSFPVMFIAANAAAYVFMSFVLMQGMVMLAVSGIPALAGGVASVIQHLTDIFSALVAAIQDIGPASFRHISLSAFEIIILYGAVADMTWFLLRRYKPALFMSIAALCLLMTSRCLREWEILHQRKIVIYNTPHACHAELAEGEMYSVLCTDTALATDIAYATLPAHTGWSAWQEQPEARKDICFINGKSLLILNEAETGNTPFPVDYLVLNNPSLTDVKKLCKTFSPSTIVAGNCFSPMQLERIAADCATCGVTLHAVSEHGAFVLSNEPSGIF